MHSIVASIACASQQHDTADNWSRSGRAPIVCSLALVMVAACSGREPRADVLSVNTAPHLNHELELAARLEEVTISPDGRIWSAIEHGQIVVSDSVLAPWRHVFYPPG